MNGLQAKEFELLCEFVNICSKYNLTYFLVCGSALGAVKYRGFIPWDDDIDVAMPRSDYEIFIKVAQECLPEHVFLQNNDTDPEFPQIYSKLRNSNTTYVEKTVAHLNINHGVFIDIFPLDPKSTEKGFELKKRFLFGRLLAFTSGRRSLRAKLLDFAFKIRYGKLTAKKTVALCNRLIRAEKADTSILCNHGNWQGTLEYAPSSQYGNGTWSCFEGLHVRIPENYDAYLTQKYGDWRADVPLSERQGHHFFETIDTDNSYTGQTTLR